MFPAGNVPPTYVTRENRVIPGQSATNANSCFVAPAVYAPPRHVTPLSQQSGHLQHRVTQVVDRNNCLQE